MFDRYDVYSYFIAGKIVFAAPSRPLVMQQIEACHNIVGIPQVRC
jgi:Fanconi anemia group M protein